MNINDFRKYVFLNSQYCIYYVENGCTVLSGIMRAYGYKFAIKLPDEKIDEIISVYRRFTTTMNILVALQVFLYVYFIVFPYFIKFMQLPYFVMIMLLSVLPLLLLYITYLFINLLYENYLIRYIGSFKKVKFKPTLYNIEPKAYEKYKNTPRKSVFVVLIMALIFCYYALTPILIDSLVGKNKYSVAIKIADLYSKVIPISPDVYAQRAYASYKLGKYKDAVKDFQLANSYSLSNSFDFDILGVKISYLPFEEALQEFDYAISKEKDVLDKQLLQSEKANYLLKNKRYIDAIDIYDSLILEYKTKSDVGFVPEMVYFNRGYAKSEIGDIYGSELDIAIAKKMFNDCKLDVETKLVRLP